MNGLKLFQTILGFFNSQGGKFLNLRWEKSNHQNIFNDNTLIVNALIKSGINQYLSIKNTLKLRHSMFNPFYCLGNCIHGADIQIPQQSIF